MNTDGLSDNDNPDMTYVTRQKAATGSRCRVIQHLALINTETPCASPPLRLSDREALSNGLVFLSKYQAMITLHAYRARHYLRGIDSGSSPAFLSKGRRLRARNATRNVSSFNCLTVRLAFSSCPCRNRRNVLVDASDDCSFHDTDR